MIKVVLFCQMLLVLSYARVLWVFRREGWSIACGGELTVRGSFWWLALACAAFPVRWWFVSQVASVQSSGELASWAALHVFCAFVVQLLLGAIRHEQC